MNCSISIPCITTSDQKTEWVTNIHYQEKHVLSKIRHERQILHSTIYVTERRRMFFDYHRFLVGMNPVTIQINRRKASRSILTCPFHLKTGGTQKISSSQSWILAYIALALKKSKVFRKWHDKGKSLRVKIVRRQIKPYVWGQRKDSAS